MSEKDGGPAFPTDRFDPKTDQFIGSAGLSLRDYFAGQALTGMVSAAGMLNRNVVPDASMIPRMAMTVYEIADAMLKERAK